MPATLLIADDEPAIRDVLRDFLSAQGYAVVTAADGTEALAVAQEASPDLVLLDVMMPGLDGFEVIRHLRRNGQTPVILLTARVAEIDRVTGLELGADDYVTKPFSLHEVAARVKAVLRRTRAQPAGGVLRGGSVTLDPERRRVTVMGEEATLTRSEFVILETLMAAPGRVYSRDQLLEVLGADEGSARTVDVHVRNLRVKIEADASDPTHVETVFGVGYRFGA